MTDLARTSYEPVLLRDAGGMVWDLVAMHDAFDLKSSAFKVLCRLRFHLCRYGQLPTGQESLAAIGRVGFRSFERMAPDLALHFSRDSEGRWSDRAILAARGGRSIMPAKEKPPVSPALSAMRSRTGKRGSDARWNPGGSHLQLVESARDAEGPPSGGSEAIANGEADLPERMAKDMAKDVDLPAGFATSLPSLAMAGASHAPGLLDRLSESQSKEKIEESDGRTDAPGASAIDSKPDGAAASFAISEAPEQMAKPVAPAMAKQAGEPMASGAAEALTPIVTTPAASQPSDDTIMEALRRVGGEQIPARLLTPQGIAPVRLLVDAGCDLVRDIVPAFELVRGLSRPLDSLRASFIHDAARANRDQAARTSTAQREQPQVPRFFVLEGSAEWRAWLKHTGRKSFPVTSSREHRDQRGWYFDSPWPPGSNPPQP